jgi:hypothetical protein
MLKLITIFLTAEGDIYMTTRAKKCMCGEIIVPHADTNFYKIECGSCGIYAKGRTKEEACIKWNVKIDNKKTELQNCQTTIKAALKTLRNYYPHKDIAEYTRLEEAITNFLNWGAW